MRLFVFLTAILPVCCLTSAWAEDWPQFRGVNRDGKSAETGLLTEWPAEGLTPLWIVQGLGKGYSSVAVANSRIFTTGIPEGKNEGILSALDVSGKVLWKTEYGPEWDQMHPGTRSTPTVDGTLLYELSGTGRLLCVDAGTGAIVWTRDLPVEFRGTAPRCGFAEAPLVYGEKLICTPGGTDASVVALDKVSGKTLWTSVGFSDQSAYCSPILIERGGRHLVVTITMLHVAGLDADTGKLLWSHAFDVGAEDPNHSVTPVYADGLLYVTSGHGKGGQMFELSSDGAEASPRWTDSTLNTVHGGLVVLDGYIYGSNAKGHWISLEFKSGQVTGDSALVGSGSIAYADGMFYCYGDKGNFGLVKAVPELPEPVSRFKVTQGEGPHWAHPVIAGGRLYIRHGECLMAYDIASKRG